jgi:NaMN:DMB phosphoribosyltransferase
VHQGLQSAELSATPSAPELLAAVGDPFQAFATGLLIGSLSSGEPLLLAGGSQMAAVLALALSMVSARERSLLSNQVLLGTTAWLAGEVLTPTETKRTSLVELLALLEDHFNVSISALASGLRFCDSRHPSLRDYELGHVKEGVGAGGLALLAQLRGLSLDRISQGCDNAMDQLLESKLKP